VDDVVQRKELASFLRSRREATDPRDVGLIPGKQRRTPGLRREELAQLSGVSVTWYTWLEQGRDIGVSRNVIDSLARVLKISTTERDHLYTLTGLRIPAENIAFELVDPALAQLVSVLQPYPAAVINLWWDLLAYNDAYSTMLGDLATVHPGERNLLRLAFTRFHSDGLLENWDGIIADLVGQLRTHLARYPNDPRGPALVEDLTATSSRFAQMWKEHGINRFQSSTVVFNSAEFGRLELNLTKLATADDESQQLVVYLPADHATETALSKTS
jgi:transcriptional regulator with XRE-family HTH domain